ncbi:LD-carboxypeptidase [Flammeovirga yaeyamensis]|uniref:LD-carboxypeptidase n=1 Tax=Flammeovirga yaeyamensis TaxID=367791 RepID=A0AAX1NAJ5_9BACT|nr:LD-carboxypeptidase [Flammeovirga yaeyamensis]MBB3697887.1 muramoyltetrapeptide carboxypeptidase [Flammeovirga yaeyamensis]NMF35758.1 LD-carboxypeptidase [Flammeovirga yaeyamensis]QWG03290.1 LD-carboxypeptidase [Flammeovirga yaeyamensis]
METLKRGDKVAVVAASGVVNIESVLQGIELLRSWGLVVSDEQEWGAEWGSLAGADIRRASRLQKAINNPEIKAIFLARGGYGITRIIDTLDWSGFIDHPKWVIGFSDVTALHSAINNLGFASIHAPMVAQFNNKELEVSVNQLQGVLFFNEAPDIIGKVKEEFSDQTIEGEVVGGNLCLIADQIGTSSELDLENKILFIEEVGEKAYQIDRMMTRLLRSGALKNIKALIMGQFSSVPNEEPPFFPLTIKQIIKEKVNVPVITDVSCGHETPNTPILLGGTYVITCSGSSAVMQFKGVDLQVKRS